VVTHPASSLAQDRESSPVETSVLTTMLRRPSPSTNPPSRRIHVISCSAAHHLQPAHHRSYTRYFRLGGPIAFNQPAAVHSWFLCAVYKCSYFTYLQIYFTHRLCCRVCIAVGNAEIHRPISSSTLKSIFISAKEVMLSSAFVCLFVSRITRTHYSTDFHKFGGKVVHGW